MSALTEAFEYPGDMKIPAITGTIRRRILLNYRVAPDVARRVLPARFRPKLVGDHAIAGICLIRLEGIRPKGFPRFIGISSENSAHIVEDIKDIDYEQSEEGLYPPEPESKNPDYPDLDGPIEDSYARRIIRLGSSARRNF